MSLDATTARRIKRQNLMGGEVESSSSMKEEVNSTYLVSQLLVNCKGYTLFKEVQRLHHKDKPTLITLTKMAMH